MALPSSHPPPPTPPPDGFTAWDRLPIAYPRLHEGVRGNSAADCLLRCIARVEPYELASRAVNDRPGPARPSAHRALAGLADDYASRVDEWSERAESPSDPNAATDGVLRPLVIVVCGIVGPLSLCALVATDPRLATLRWWPAALMAAPLVLPLTWTTLGTVVRLASPRTTPGRALRDRRCPDCATPLKDAAPGIAPSLVKGAAFGPRACPRCRRPWPLVPPPAPEKGTPYSRA